MADGAIKAIDQIKVGDTIANSVPGAKGAEAHKVTAVIVTHTDHDFVDLAIRKTDESVAKSSVKAGVKSLAKKAARKAVFGLAASAAILGALSAGHGHGDTHQSATAPVAAVTKTSSAPLAKSGVEAKAAHLTTTFHHPFYDETQSAFVEAKDLKPGDVLQTPTGTAQVTGVRLYHANTTTYDLTIGTLHTYYVEAGTTPVLVDNTNFISSPGSSGSAACSANWVPEGGFQNSTPPAPSTRSGWFRFQSAAAGSRSDIGGRSLVPQYSAPDGAGGVITAKFDSAFGDEAIDRNLGLTGFGKGGAERQVAVAAHPGFQAVYIAVSSESGRGRQTPIRLGS
jgi:hypothetical protein